MDQFSSLSFALVPHFESSFADLPADLQKRVGEAFLLLQWDSTPTTYRRYRALQTDFESDPECNQALERMWDLHCQIAETEAAAAPTVNDLELRDTRLHHFEDSIRDEEQKMQMAAFARWRLPADFLPSDNGAELGASAVGGTGLPGRPSQTVHLIQDELDRRITANQLEDGVNKQAEVLFDWLRTEHPTFARPKPASIANAIRTKFRAARIAIAQN